MPSNELIILNGPDVADLLEGREAEVLNVVERAYAAHAAENGSSLPHSVFLRFPGHPANRIIALPAWLGEGFNVAGMKWVASFPGNLQAGIDRASAVLVLNSPATGLPEAILEGSIVSAKRTAASAALAARCLYRGPAPERAGIIGCGLINFEVARFLCSVYPSLRAFHLADTDERRAAAFAARLTEDLGIREIAIAGAEAVLARCPLASFATNAGKPHIRSLSMCAPGSVVLLVSLRDIAPDALLECDNVADDIDHVCRAETSVHLAEQLTGSRSFIRGEIADFLGAAPALAPDPDRVTVFSPFGLGILDLAVGQLVCNLGREQGRALILDSFLPQPWQRKERKETDAIVCAR